jgi:hypothetical protein
MIVQKTQTLSELRGLIATCNELLVQAHPTSEEFWRIQQRLAGYERMWAEAEHVWKVHNEPRS